METKHTVTFEFEGRLKRRKIIWRLLMAYVGQVWQDAVEWLAERRLSIEKSIVVVSAMFALIFVIAMILVEYRRMF